MAALNSYSSAHLSVLSPNEEAIIAKRPMIAVLGCTGAGKSAFINTLCGEKRSEVSEGDASCTQDVIFVNTAIDKQTITLLDTPGFDDSNNDEGVILNSMASWLLDTAQMDMLLSGVIILQSLAERRVGKTEKRRIRLLESIIGHEVMSHVVVVFTHGDLFAKEDRGNRIIRRKKSENWGRLSLPESQYLDIDSRKFTDVQRPVRLLMKKPKRLLLMQTELQEFDGDTARTTAGSYLLSELREDLKNVSRATPSGNTTLSGGPTYSPNYTAPLQVANSNQYASHPAPVRPDLLSNLQVANSNQYASHPAPVRLDLPSNQYQNSNSGPTLPGYQVSSARSKTQPRDTHSHQVSAPIAHRAPVATATQSSSDPYKTSVPISKHSQNAARNVRGSVTTTLPLSPLAHPKSVMTATTATQSGSNMYDQNVRTLRPPYNPARSFQNPTSTAFPLSPLANSAPVMRATTATQSGLNTNDQNARTLRHSYNAASNVQNSISTTFPPLPAAHSASVVPATTGTQSGFNTNDQNARTLRHPYNAAPSVQDSISSVFPSSRASIKPYQIVNNYQIQIVNNWKCEPVRSASVYSHQKQYAGSEAPVSLIDTMYQSALKSAPYRLKNPQTTQSMLDLRQEYDDDDMQITTQPNIGRSYRSWARTPARRSLQARESSPPPARRSKQSRTQRLSFDTDDENSSTNDDEVDDITNRPKPTTPKKDRRVRRASSENSLLVTTTTGNQAKKRGKKITLKPLKIATTDASETRRIQLQTQIDAINQGVPKRSKTELLQTFFPLVKSICSGLHSVWKSGFLRAGWKLLKKSVFGT